MVHAHNGLPASPHAGSYTATGRTGQKSRTQRALVDALRRLMADGQDPSVSDIAASAGISRTTAYRYFPDKESLLNAAMPQTGERSLLGEDPPSDVAERLDRTLDAHFAFIRDWEPQMRAALRASLAPGAGQPALRGGRAVRWYEEALAPLAEAHPGIDVHRLAVRLRAAAGIEPYVWLTGVGGLVADEAFAAMKSNALDILHAAMRGA
ncbi:TetR/AcrR family transcriptional regulator [Sinomonas atrocyanea]|uniref:TetR/AcrR family transcriptional regulator n=1 Tax=Sinomonas atrocyanea TaxID=37927 RepID=UPI003D99ECB9